MNEILLAAAVGAAFGLGRWSGVRSAYMALARFAVRSPLEFLAFAHRAVAAGRGVRHD
ncbi:hypothetical protein [Pseudoxanthomonas kalamensis]|uniref:hypothetical protein n=1 Tax=Pseudoxanthomonas kalamensis TaxID=289483 RepID=UPI0013912233|nr:hypothetical protein [Pseudoxanthomonas kalamensis]